MPQNNHVSASQSGQHYEWSELDFKSPVCWTEFGLRSTHERPSAERSRSTAAVINNFDNFSDK